jgi:hypothetical protein
MPNPFNIEKIRADQEVSEKKKAECEELVWEPIIDGYPSDDIKPPAGLQGARARWEARTKHAVMRDEAAVTQVHLFTPVHRKHAEWGQEKSDKAVDPLQKEVDPQLLVASQGKGPPVRRQRLARETKHKVLFDYL